MHTDKILLQGMNFFGFHGTLPAERDLGQRFVVDLALHCDLRAAGQGDQLSLTVDYSAVYQQVRAIVEGEPVGLIETVAERIATAVLGAQPLVNAIEVTIAKPFVRLQDTVLGGSAVQILRQRPS